MLQGCTDVFVCLFWLKGASLHRCKYLWRLCYTPPLLSLRPDQPLGYARGTAKRSAASRLSAEHHHLGGGAAAAPSRPLCPG